VVLLDEIEKAHPDVLLVLLQVLDAGVLTDARGRKATFHETIVVMTSNLPLDEPASRRVAGFHGADRTPTNAKEAADADRRHALARHLRPEFVGRIGAIVPFRALSAGDVEDVVALAVANIEQRLRGQGITLPDGERVRARVSARVGALALGVRQVERIAEEECGRALEQGAVDAAGERVLLDSLRASSIAAILIFDMVGSTRFIAELGETAFTSSVRRLVETVRCHATAEDLLFLKCTGDGVFALYGSVASAFDAAIAVAGTFADAAAAPLLRRVVHFGRVRHGPAGEPLGVEVHRAFRMEAIKAQDRLAGPEGVTLPTAPFVTSRAARDQLDEGRSQQLSLAGTYRLSGFDEPMELWLHGGRKGEWR
jgi:class 3 adenylate cyclase